MNHLTTTLPFEYIREKNGVYYLSEAGNHLRKEQLYLKVREKEGRLYPDDMLRSLPRIGVSHPLRREWQMRENSMERLMVYLTEKEKPLKILDVGCGNGWMTSKLAGITECEVYGIDMNVVELEQGARVFEDNRHLVFFYGDISEDIFPPGFFDVIVLASSVQYFPDLKICLARLFRLMTTQGEVHILDSPFYEKDTIAAAKQRTIDYFEKLGTPEMTGFYHHHLRENPDLGKGTVLYQPNSLYHRIKRKVAGRHDSPFPWIRISKPPRSL